MGTQKTFSAEEALEIANEAANNGDREKAMKYYEAILVKYPDNEAAMAGVRRLNPGNLLQADLDDLNGLFQQRMFKDVEIRAGLFLEQYPKVYELYNLLGASIGIQGRDEEALPYFEKAVELKPFNANAHCNVANALKATGDLDKAMVHYIRALDLNPKHLQALNNFGNLLMSKGDAESAIEVFDRALALDSGSFEVLVNAAGAYKSNADYEKAISTYHKAIEINASTAQVFLDLALCEQAVKNFEEAENIYLVITNEDPQNFDAKINFGNMLHGRGRYDEAVFQYENAIRVNPNSTIGYNNLSNIYRDMGDLAKAESYLNQALDLDPNAVEVLVNLADVHKALGRYKKAISLLNHVHELVPTGSVTITNLVILNFLIGEDEKAAHFLDMLSDEFILSIRDFRKRQFCSAYKIYLKGLFKYNQDKERVHDLDKERLWVIGGSVSLIAKGHMAKVDGKNLLIDGKWIIGGKAFHIGKEGNNMFKASMEQHLSEMDEGTRVLYMFGSIDCRLDEGIIPVAKKIGKSVQEVTAKTVGDYFNNAMAMSRDAGVVPAFASVPAPNFVDGQEVSQELIDVIVMFNKELKGHCDAEGIKYIDTYNLTDAGEGHADGSRNIDSHHVHPDVITEALASC